MKFISAILTVFLFSSICQAATIDLAPGSSIRIRSGEEAVISCSGQSSAGGSECRVQNIPRYNSIYDVYAGPAKVGTNLSLEDAGNLISKLKNQGICR